MYTRVTWANGTTPVNDTNLNVMDMGVNNLYTWIDKNNANDLDVLAAHDFVFADTSTVGFTLTLPATPTQGDLIRICDATGSFGANNLTLGRNGENIMGLAEDLVLDQPNTTVDLTYSTSHGWVITSKT